MKPYHTKKKPFPQILMMFFWALFLLLTTWVQSLEKLLDFQAISFKWVWTPDFLSFFRFYDITLIHRDFLIVKLGHFLGFAVMDLLIYNVMRNHKTAIRISIVFAFLTELFQLFFGRDGRLYDLMIDSLGVLSVYVLLQLNHTLKEK